MTKRKKELVELMYEAGIREFPEGGEFAAQDKPSREVFFYKDKPTEYNEGGIWLCTFNAVGDWHNLPSLCKNWHRTLVTREQYAEYCKMREREESSESEVVEVAAKDNSCEQSQPSILDMMRHCNELRDVAKQKADEAASAVGDYNDAMESLKSAALALGYNIEPIDVSGELSPSSEAEKPLDITDWRDLQVGDVIECQPKSAWLSIFIGEQCTVKRIEGSEYDGSLTILAESPDGLRDWGDEFKFIRRP